MLYHTIIKELESNSSRIFKENILLREMKQNNEIFFEALSLAYNKLITFGVKQIHESNVSGDGINFEEFRDLATKLNKRDLTGYNARDEIIKLMNKANKDEWNLFYRRILIKDLRCGLSEKTINNVAKKELYPNFKIPVFQCQLAQDSEQHKKKLNGQKIIEVKLDGVRVISILHKNGKVDMFSRNGKELLNFNNVKSQLKECLKINKLHQSLILDGEIVSTNFQELMKQIYRKDNVQNNDAILNLFDFLPFDEFKKGLSTKTQTERYRELRNWYFKNNNRIPNVKIIDYKIIDLDKESGRNDFRIFNNKAVMEGYEGIMIKDPNAKYESKRSSSWLKLKPVIEISLKVKSVEEGTGRNTGKLGAITAEGEDNGKKFKISVGSGFTDSQREFFWKEKVKLINQIIEIKADAITKSQDGKLWSARFPRFKTFRGFEKNEKI